MTRLCGPSIVGTASCLIHIEAAVLDRLTAMWRRGESYSDAILRLVETKARA